MAVSTIVVGMASFNAVRVLSICNEELSEGAVERTALFADISAAHARIKAGALEAAFAGDAEKARAHLEKAREAQSSIERACGGLERCLNAQHHFDQYSRYRAGGARYNEFFIGRVLKAAADGDATAAVGLIKSPEAAEVSSALDDAVARLLKTESAAASETSGYGRNAARSAGRVIIIASAVSVLAAFLIAPLLAPGVQAPPERAKRPASGGSSLDEIEADMEKTAKALESVAGAVNELAASCEAITRVQKGLAERISEIRNGGR